MIKNTSASKSALQKALTSTTEPNMYVADIEQTLHEELLNLQPLAILLETIQAEGLTHEYRAKTSHPKAWFEGESTINTGGNTAISRATVALKIQRIWGGVTGLAKVDKRFVDAMALELVGNIEGMADLMEFGAIHGCANDIGFTGDAYQYSGMLPRLYSYAPANIIDAAGAKVTLDMLDQAVGKAARYRQTRSDPSLWLMGQRMRQVVDGLQTKINIALTNTVLNDGKITMANYYDRPIYETDYVTPTTASPSDLACSAVAGGTLTNVAHRYQIASVTETGEQVAGAVTSPITPATTNLSVGLAWTADANAKSYMIFRKVDTAASQLIDIIPALTYDGTGKVNGTVATYIDTGAKVAKAVKPLASGEESIIFVNTNPNRGIAFVGLVDDMGSPVPGQLLTRFVELGKTRDATDWFLKSYNALRLVYPNLISVVRHTKTA